MIVDFAQLADLRGAVTMVDGAFDPLHAGHLRYFSEAARLGLPLLCNVAGDDYVRTKHPPLLPEEQRTAVIDALQPIAYTHLNTRTTTDVLRQLQPRRYVKGRDWDGKLPGEQVAACAELDIEVVLLDTVQDSSSRLIGAWLTDSDRFGLAVAEFERAVLAQTPVPAAHYDREYFVSDWRAGGNDYTLESRRALEGRHPALIVETFQPRRVLDLGCGPGALMSLLDELGVIADGIDFSPASRALAPERVRDRITVAPVTDPPCADNAYDLVICREVLEHLTVLEIQRAIQAMARISARYVYLTTRFHPAPSSLVSLTTQFEVDPTHISLLTKDFVRVLLVLAGFRSRPDLEARMDWLRKGRVLVMEKVTP